LKCECSGHLREKQQRVSRVLERCRLLPQQLLHAIAPLPKYKGFHVLLKEIIGRGTCMKTGLRSPSPPNCLRTQYLNRFLGCKVRGVTPVVELVAKQQPLFFNQRAETCSAGDYIGRL
jgi:hypothetical protein